MSKNKTKVTNKGQGITNGLFLLFQGKGKNSTGIYAEEYRTLMEEILILLADPEISKRIPETLHSDGEVGKKLWALRGFFDECMLNTKEIEPCL